MSHKCNCNLDAKKIQCKKENENKGRYFYTCATNQCKYFKWANIILSGVNCPKCNANLDKRTCNKANVNQNRHFYSCSDCNYFKWKHETLQEEEERRTRNIYKEEVFINNYPPVYPQTKDEVEAILDSCKNNQIYFPKIM